MIDLPTLYLVVANISSIEEAGSVAGSEAAEKNSVLEFDLVTQPFADPSLGENNVKKI